MSYLPINDPEFVILDQIKAGLSVEDAKQWVKRYRYDPIKFWHLVAAVNHSEEVIALADKAVAAYPDKDALAAVYQECKDSYGIAWLYAKRAVSAHHVKQIHKS